MAGALSAAQLARFQTVATAALDVSGIVIKRPTRTQNAWGGYAETLATVATVAGAWAQPNAAIMQQYAGVIGAQKAWVVRLPYGTDVRRDDQLAMPSGDTLTVQATLSARSYATCVRVLATEIV